MPEIVIEYEDSELDAFIERQIQIRPGRGHLRRGYKIQLPNMSEPPVKVYQVLIDANKNSRATRPENIGSVNETFQTHNPSTIEEFRTAHIAMHGDNRVRAQNLIAARLQFENRKIMTLIQVPELPEKKVMTVRNAELNVIGTHFDQVANGTLDKTLEHNLLEDGYHIHLKHDGSPNPLNGYILRVNSATDAAKDAMETAGGRIIELSQIDQVESQRIHPIIIEFVNDIIGGDSFLGKTIEIRILNDIAIQRGLPYIPPTNEQESNNIDGSIGTDLYSIKPATWEGWTRGELNLAGEVNFIGYHIKSHERGKISVEYQETAQQAVDLYSR